MIKQTSSNQVQISSGGGGRGLVPIPAVIGQQVGYTQDRSSVHHRATQ